MDFAAIPAGDFWMGWESGLPGERPRHRVWLPGFGIARRPVTNAEYDTFAAATGGAPPPFRADPRFADREQPVVAVRWDDAVAFCAWLGPGHRLPTEAEWERAARGGIEDARYPWGDAPPESVQLPLGGPPRVGGGPANGFGLTDLTGCVHEWCLDWHADGYYAVSPERSPAGPPTGTRRVSRGGAWRHQNPWSSVAHRSSLPPGLRYSDYGFRVAREARPGRL